MLDLLDMIASPTEYFANDKETIDHCACKYIIARIGLKRFSRHKMPHS